MPVVTNAELASAVQQVVSRVDAREDQLTAWQSGVPDGGPFADGTYAITNLLGETSYFKSPARLEYEVSLLTTAGTGAVATAEAARDAAEAVLASAVVQATNASSSASTASTKASEAQVFRNEAANSEANALAHRNAASASASAAALSEADAEAAAIAAAASAASADADATSAAASAAAAATFDPVNFYTKTQADTLLAAKLATADFSWNNLAGKPATFTPSAHTHAIADVTGLQAALDGKQAAGSYAAAVHGHSISDVTGLQTALDGKQAAGSYAAASHTHVIADVTGLQAALDGKQPAGSYLTGITGTMVTTALGYTPYNATNPNGYISGINSSMVTTALGYTPYNSSNPAGYITGINSGNVTTALGYTPANKAGDTFSGAITVNSGLHQVVLAADGSIEVTRSGGGAYIDFKDSTSEDYDVRLQASGNVLAIGASGGMTLNGAGVLTGITSGMVTTALGFTPANKAGDTFTGLLTVSGTGLSAAVQLSNTSGGRDLRVMQKDDGRFVVTDETAGAERLAISVSGNVTSLVDFRAPIYYDSNNTGYYVDPASTSVLNGLNVGNNTPVYSSGSFQYHQYQSPHVAYVKKTGGYSWYWRRNDTGLSGGANEVEDMSLTEGGSLIVRTDIRAPQFLDSNNTGYYFDGSGTTRTNAINTNSLYSFGNITAEGDLIVGTGKNASYLYMQDADEGQRTLHCNSNRIGFLTQAGGWGAWCDDDGTWGTDTACNAPIFYDRNDTGYYLNPNGTSNLNQLTMAGLITGRSCAGTDVNSANDTGSFSVRGSSTTIAAMSFHRTGAYAINMGLGTDNVFRIGGWSASSNVFQMDGSGNLTMLGNVTAYSDARLKTDVETISGALDIVSQLRGVRYTRIDSGERQVGVIAQETLQVVPEVVQQGIGDDDTLSVAYGNLVSVLIEAIKELKSEVEILKATIH